MNFGILPIPILAETWVNISQASCKFAAVTVVAEYITKSQPVDTYTQLGFDPETQPLNLSTLTPTGLAQCQGSIWHRYK